MDKKTTSSNEETKSNNQTQNSINVDAPKLPNSNEIKDASEEQLIALVKQINTELENRKKGQGEAS